ncbi:MAG: PQQ-dependent sugar dehydrogenase [Anaerolineae bacterium]|nr:PQQ-dependent sugar dehydrogenase [Anaerolineae bacterium]
MHRHVLGHVRPGERVANPESIELPAGYQIEALVTDLNCPTAISWEPGGTMLIAESWLPYGAAAEVEPRILRRRADGSLEPFASGFEPPINDIAFHRGLLYVSHRGRISVVEGGCVRDLVTGLPSWGLHQNTTLAFDAAGRMHFGQGTVSNAGVLGPVELERLITSGHAHARDLPGEPVVLTGVSYEVTNPVSGEARLTGPFLAWGAPAAPGQRLPGPVPGAAASGAIMRASSEGSDLHVLAWGLRNPFGLAFGPDGQLYVTNQGARPLEPRPIAGDPDGLYVVQEGAWYGWPDFAAGQPVSDAAFQQPGLPRHQALLANHAELLKGQTRPPRPLVTLGLQVGAAGLDFCLEPRFGFAGQAFIAEFGPLLTPREQGSGPCTPGGHRVVRVDPLNGAASEFAINRSRLPASLAGNTGGLERPTAVRFGPDGGLYIVDCGVIEFREEAWGWVAVPTTGIIWRVTHSGMRV